MKKLTNKAKIKIAGIIIKLSFTAILAALFYIICRASGEISTFEDMSFRCAVPEMLEQMLLSVAIVTGFMAASAYILRE